MVPLVPMCSTTSAPRWLVLTRPSMSEKALEAWRPSTASTVAPGRASARSATAPSMTESPMAVTLCPSGRGRGAGDGEAGGDALGPLHQSVAQLCEDDGRGEAQEDIRGPGEWNVRLRAGVDEHGPVPQVQPVGTGADPAAGLRAKDPRQEAPRPAGRRHCHGSR